MEIYRVCRSFDEWQTFAQQNPQIFSAEETQRLLGAIRKEGLVEPFTLRRYPPHEVIVKGENYRETIRAGGLISRHRALLKVCEHLSAIQSSQLLKRQTRIYAPEALTDFALYMRSSFPKFIGSEYAENPGEIADLFPIKAENLLALSYPSDVFDVVFSNDVFEHVPDVDKALSEISRILVPCGLLISTFPFLYRRESGLVKARLVDGALQFLMDPEYHGNPMRPDEGSLVFELPGWNILHRARSSGFADSYMAFISSDGNGILGAEINGVFVFVATKRGD